MKNILVNSAAGVLGGHRVKLPKAEGRCVRAVGLNYHEFAASPTDEFLIGDRGDPEVVRQAISDPDEGYQLTADKGGAGYIFIGEHDAQVMHNSATISLNTPEQGKKAGVKKFFCSSSACMYPEYNQIEPENPRCSEDSACPAAPDSEYGWETVFNERLYVYICAITALRLGSRASITPLAQKAPGVEAERRPSGYLPQNSRGPVRTCVRQVSVP